MLSLHMRTVKAARRQHGKMQTIWSTLRGSTFRKKGECFLVDAKQRGGGILLTLQRQGKKGNRFQRKIHYSHFLEASFSPGASNVALAARLNLNPSTIPKLQKTCASLCMGAQTKLLCKILCYCRKSPPTTALLQHSDLVFFYLFLFLL